jgi:hypothetical protein
LSREHVGGSGDDDKVMPMMNDRLVEEEKTLSEFDMEMNGAVEVTYSWRSTEASLVYDQWCWPCKGCKGRNWFSKNLT